MPMKLAIVLGQMWDGDHMGRGWWWVMGIGWLIFLALLVVLVVVLVRGFTNDRARGSADDILAERFARGEIDEDEYPRRRRPARLTAHQQIIGERDRGEAAMPPDDGVSSSPPPSSVCSSRRAGDPAMPFPHGSSLLGSCPEPHSPPWCSVRVRTPSPAAAPSDTAWRIGWTTNRLLLGAIAGAGDARNRSRTCRRSPTSSTRHRHLGSGTPSPSTSPSRQASPPTRPRRRWSDAVAGSWIDRRSAGGHRRTGSLMRPATMFTDTVGGLSATSRSCVTITDVVMPCLSADGAEQFEGLLDGGGIEASGRYSCRQAGSRARSAKARATRPADALLRRARGFHPVGLVGEVDLGQEFFGARAALAARERWVPNIAISMFRHASRSGSRLCS